MRRTSSIRHPTLYRIMSLTRCSPSIRTILLLRNSAVSFAEDEKVEVVTNRPFVALWRSRLPKKIPNRPRADVVAFCVALGLDVDAIKPEGVLINHTVNTVVAAAAERASSVRRRTAVAHTKE
jgi:hypothetical protein